MRGVHSPTVSAHRVAPPPQPEGALDVNSATKWLCHNGPPWRLAFRLSPPDSPPYTRVPAMYSITTANDSPGRDPTSWVLACGDGPNSPLTNVTSVAHFDTRFLGRFTSYGRFSMFPSPPPPLPAPPSPPPPPAIPAPPAPPPMPPAPSTNEIRVGGIAPEDALTWHMAAAQCRTWNMVLASVRSAEENEAFTRLCRDVAHGCWLGYSDTAVEGTWVWLDGSASDPGSYTNWAAGEPNGNTQREEDGAYLRRRWGAFTPAGYDGRWDDGSVIDKKGYICRRDEHAGGSGFNGGLFFLGMILPGGWILPLRPRYLERIAALSPAWQYAAQAGRVLGLVVLGVLIGAGGGAASYAWGALLGLLLSAIGMVGWRRYREGSQASLTSLIVDLVGAPQRVRTNPLAASDQSVHADAPSSFEPPAPICSTTIDSDPAIVSDLDGVAPLESRA